MLGVAAPFMLGLLAKPMLVTTPILLLLLDYWPLRRLSPGDRPGTPLAKLAVEKIPLFALAVGAGVVTMYAQSSARAVADFQSLPWALRVANAVHAVGWYLWKTFLPTGLCAFYPHPGHSLDGFMVAGSGGVLLVVTAWAWWTRRQNPQRLVGWLWLLISLLPVLGLLQVGGQAHADRYTYLPHVGLFLLLVWEVRAWLERFPGGRTGAGILTGIVLVLCLRATHFQAATWQNNETLWTHAQQLDPLNPIANSQLGYQRVNEGKLDDAIPLFEDTLKRWSHYKPAVLQLAWIHEQREDWPRSAEHYAWALRLDPQSEVARKRLAWIRENHPEAIRTIHRKPTTPPALAENRLGLQDARSGKMQSALAHFRSALALDPQFADAHNNAALALIELGQAGKAEHHFQRAIEHAPESTEFRINFVQLLESTGQIGRALEELEETLKQDPGNPEVRAWHQRLKR
jgi:tetratricopeptide (TPR) repeat protein